MDELTDFRLEKDDFFANSAQSPLTASQKKVFQGLSYFPENPELRLKTTLIPFEKQDKVQIQTTTGALQVYTRLGRIKFTIEGHDAELTIYSDKNGYFLPFVDALAGSETYGAGRYLEPELIGKNQFLVDFNLAYNPYCVYNEGWSCPVTPRENRTTVPIRAGEKLPNGAWTHLD